MLKFRYGKPLIGLAGGIGSGKSFVARALATEGCGIVDSDALSRQILERPEVTGQIAGWWGAKVLDSQGHLDRKKLGQNVFSDQTALQRLNGLIHPLVGVLRQNRTAELAANPAIPAIIWDTPLLFETGLNAECDAVIFVKSLYDSRLNRVMAERGWTASDLAKRENAQISLDKKEKIADYVVDNSGEEASTLHQVHEVLSRILSTQASRN